MTAIFRRTFLSLICSLFTVRDDMPYKIVETVEKGKCKLFLVPNNWEQNNILHWPKWKVETLLAAEDSYPDASWHNMKCQVKRTGLLLIANAEAELVKMCQKSDTESEEFEYQIPFKSQVAIAQEDKRNMNSIQELFTCTSVSFPFIFTR